MTKSLSAKEKAQLAVKITDLLTNKLGDDAEEKIRVLDIVASLIVPCAMVKVQGRES